MTSLEIPIPIPIPIAIASAAVLLIGLVVFYVVYLRKSGLKRKIKKISAEYQRHIVIPDGLDGYIELDYLLLTSYGLVVLDYRETHGTVFPGAQLDQWTVLQDNQRFSIQNPFVTMRHRLNAVKGLVKDVPVSGVVVFSDKAQFGNEPPEGVIKESDLLVRFDDKDNTNKATLITAFHQPYKYLTNIRVAE